MTALNISATSEALTVNGKSWSDAPLTTELCHVIGADDLTEGGIVVVDGKAIARFRYFEDLGIALLESIREGRIWRIAIYLALPSSTPRKASVYKTYGHEFQRSPKMKFCGQLIINGKQLRTPLRSVDFPMKGELQFIQGIAIGPKISASMSVTSGFVQYVSFEFKRGD